LKSFHTETLILGSLKKGKMYLSGASSESTFDSSPIKLFLRRLIPRYLVI
jgi:hypothetical protein